MRPKVHQLWSAMRRRIRFFAVAIQAGHIFWSNLEENRSFLSSMRPRYASKGWWNHQLTISSQLSFQSEIDKLWSWFYFTTMFLDYDRIARLKVHLKVVLNSIVRALPGEPASPECTCSPLGKLKIYWYHDLKKLQSLSDMREQP